MTLIRPSASESTTKPNDTRPAGSRWNRVGARLGVGMVVFCTLKGFVYLALAAGGVATLWP